MNVYKDELKSLAQSVSKRITETMAHGSTAVSYTHLRTNRQWKKHIRNMMFLIRHSRLNPILTK